MDLVPKPPQVLAAAGNVAHSLLYGGLADLRPMPRTLIADGRRREVYHYRSDPDVPTTGDPVLLVTPLAAPSLCFDLRRGCSLVEHLVASGRPTYLVEYGEVSFADRALGLEHWIDEAVPTAIAEVSAHAGGRPVHVVGWSLGGIFALLTAADRPDLPIASVVALGTPFDVRQVPIVAPLRPLLTLSDWPGLVTRAYQAMGGVPKPVVAWAFQLSSFQKLVTKPLAVAAHLDDADYLAQLEAVDRFTARMTAYPGRTFGQLYHRFLKGNALRSGELELSGRTISMGALTAPTMVCAGNTDGIAPVKAVQALVPLLTGTRELRFEIVPGGHLGMLTGRAARATTWRALDEWCAQWDSAPTVVPAAPASSRRTAARADGTAERKAATRKPAARKAAGTKPVGKQAASRTKAAAPTPATAPDTQPDSIGTSRTRRYGSAGSRALSV